MFKSHTVTLSEAGWLFGLMNAGTNPGSFIRRPERHSSAQTAHLSTP